MPFFTPQQTQALELLDWLLASDQRRSGRTTIIAIGLVRQAARLPRTWVDFVDHSPHGRPGVRDQVLTMIDLDPLLHRRVTATRDRFMLDLAAPIEDWLPEGYRRLPQPTVLPVDRPLGTVLGSDRSRFERMLTDELGLSEACAEPP